MELVTQPTPRLSPEVHRHIVDMVDITSEDEFAFSFIFEVLASRQEIKRWVVDHIEQMIAMGLSIPEGETGVIDWPDNLKQRATEHLDKIREIAETINTYSSMYGRPVTGITPEGSIHFHIGDLEVPVIDIPTISTT